MDTVVGNFPDLRVVRSSREALGFGFEVQTNEGVSVRITTVEKTIEDCFKHRNKVGLDVALEALKEARRKKRIDQDEL